MAHCCLGQFKNTMWWWWWWSWCRSNVRKRCCHHPRQRSAAKTTKWAQSNHPEQFHVKLGFVVDQCNARLSCEMQLLSDADKIKQLAACKCLQIRLKKKKLGRTWFSNEIFPMQVPTNTQNNLVHTTMPCKCKVPGFHHNSWKVEICKHFWCLMWARFLFSLMQKLTVRIIVKISWK